MSNFVTLSKDEFEALLPKGFKQVSVQHVKEIVYDISTEKENLSLRIYSTIDLSGFTRDKGSDAIRIVHWDNLNSRPLGKGAKILRVEGATTVGDRIKQRISEMMEKCKDIEIRPLPKKNIWPTVDPSYVKAILESPVLGKNGFAKSLLGALDQYGSLTDGQLAYVLGELNPKNRPTLENEVKAFDTEFSTRYFALSDVQKETPQVDLPAGFEEQESPISTRKIEVIEAVDGKGLELIPTKGYPYYDYPFPNFNILQTLSYPYRNNDSNVLISGQTSSGKTIAAEFFVDKAIEDGKKVVYVCPLRALGSEREEDWLERYSDKEIVMLTGDTLFNKAEREKQMKKAAKSDIIVATNELLDSITRKYMTEQYFFLREVGLLIVDEAHLIAMKGRGDITESTIIRFAKINPKCRILFLSANMTNLSELRDWVASLNRKKTDTVNCSWRPVPLNLMFVEYERQIGNRGREDYSATQIVKEQKAIDIIMSKPDEKFLCFVHSKVQGKSIMRKLRELGEETYFHNADLEREERADIEKSFKQCEGGLRVMVSTSTSAIGVNLPARNVVIVGTTRGMDEVDILEMTQEVGRAGRPQYDDEANAYVIVAEGSSKFWEGRFKEGRPIDSVINNHRILAYHILSEIQIKEVRNVRDMLKWFRKTLAYRQEMVFEEADAKGLADDLLRMKMIKLNPDGINFSITNLGRVSAMLMYSPYDVYSWYVNFSKIFSPMDGQQPIKLDDLTLAAAIANVPSNDYGYIGKELKEECDDLNWKLTNRGLSVGNTAPFVLAAWRLLSGKDVDGPVAAMARTIKYDCERTAQALNSIDFMYSHWGEEDLWKMLPDRLKYGIPEHLVALTRLPGIGAKRAKALYEVGIETVADIANEENKNKLYSVLSPLMVKKVVASAINRVNN